MENVRVILEQVLIMALFAAIGYILVKVKKLEPSASKSISNVLIYGVTPGVIIHALQREFDITRARMLLLSFILSAMAFAVFILAAQLLCRRGKRQNIGCDRFAMTLPNAGYVGIPLVQAVLGEEGVFLLTAYLVCFNLLMFSYGRFQLLRDGEELGAIEGPVRVSGPMLRQCLINPATISVAVGVSLYLLNIRLPDVLLSVTSGLAGLNSVLSMLLIGMFLSLTNMSSVLRFRRGYLISAMRLVALPAVVMALLLLPDVSRFTNDPYLSLTTIFILSCTPSAVATSFMGELCGANHLYAAKMVIISTLMSVVTLPLMLLVWDFVWAALGRAA